MRKTAIVAALFVAAGLTGAGALLLQRLLAAQENSERAIARLSARLDAAERRRTQPVQQLAAAATPAFAIDATTATADARSSNDERVPDEPLLMNAMREVVVRVEKCALANRTLRCSFNVTNQSPAERKFILGVGGRYSRFEAQHGGASVFDDVGNDFLSAGGGVGNHAEPNCDGGTTCEVEKTLTPRVQTPAWLRFDNVEPRATVMKLLRIKWSDGESWVTMDFRNIPIARDGE